MGWVSLHTQAFNSLVVHDHGRSAEPGDAWIEATQFTNRPGLYPQLAFE